MPDLPGPVWRPLLLLAILEEIISEIYWELIVLQKLLASGMRTVPTVEYIEGAVVICSPEEYDVVSDRGVKRKTHFKYSM